MGVQGGKTGETGTPGPGSSPRVVVVVPTYNERDNIRPFLSKLLQCVPDAHVLFVDDNSPDGTGEVIQESIDANPAHISMLRREAKSGLGAAYVAGYLHALERFSNAEYFIQMDADLSHDPAYVPDLLNAMDSADVAVGSRYVHGVSIVNWPLHRLLISRFGTGFAKLVTGMPITDLTSGFKCYRADVLRAMDLTKIRANGYVFQVETVFRAWRMGYRLKDVPIIFYERTTGVSKMNLDIAFEAFLVVLRLGAERLFSPTSMPAARDHSRGS
ncbi:MAG: polyprenol monophosphomannose synthase [Candidatus Hydrogenedentes bacterium]|nr:polyprenol monophosphomannose synthase [Candidatus Hydrogenedentota bacterium]